MGIDAGGAAIAAAGVAVAGRSARAARVAGLVAGVRGVVARLGATRFGVTCFRLLDFFTMIASLPIHIGNY